MTFPWLTRRPLLASLAALTVPVSAEAHAILVESIPASGASIPAGSISVRLRYNSRIDRTRSRLTLTKPDKTQAVLPIDPSGPDDLLTSSVALMRGVYVLRWQVLAIDGHITRGDVQFTVTGP
jgi:methionine-rich copper-binding protein CopC